MSLSKCVNDCSVAQSIALVKLYKKRMLELRPAIASSRKSRRDYYELCQKIGVIMRNRELYKQIPKERRSISVSISRSASSGLHHDLTFGDDYAEFQSGVTLRDAAIGASAVAVGLSSYQIMRSLRSSARSVETALQGPVTGLLQQLSDMLNSLKEVLGSWWKAPAVIMLYLAVKSFSVTAAIISFITPLVRDIVGQSWQYLSSFFYTAEPQSGGTLDLANFVVTLASCLMVPNKDPTVMVGEIQRRVANAERFSGGMSHLFEQGVKYLEKVVNVVASMFTDRRVEWTSQTERLVQAWTDKVDAFEIKSLKGNVELGELAGAMKLLQEGVGFRQVLKTSHIYNHVNRYMDRLQGSIQAHRGALDAANAFRMQPLCGMLGGASGVGKTTAVKWLASAVLLLSKTVNPNEVLNNMWQKGISEYWNGYVQQKVYVMDDCFQQKTDGKQLDNEAMFLIRAVGNWAFPLNFADLDSKGRFYFTSDVILGTTNVSNIHDVVSPMVNQPDAVSRRIQYGYWVTVAPWCSVNPEAAPEVRKLDYRKVVSYIQEKRKSVDAKVAAGIVVTVDEYLDMIPWSAWQLMPHSFDKAVPPMTQNAFTLLDLAKLMAKEYVERRSQHAEEVDELHSWATGIAGAIELQAGRVHSVKSSLSSWFTSSRETVETQMSLPELQRTSDSYCANWIVPPLEDLEDIVETGSVKCDATRRVHDSRDCSLRQMMEERYHRADWIGKAIDTLCEWCDSAHLPPLLKSVLHFIDNEQVQHSDPASYRPVDPAGVRKHNVSRILRLGVVALICATVFKISKVILDFLVDGFRRFFGVSIAESGAYDVPRAQRGAVRVPRFSEAQMGSPPKDDACNRVYNNSYKLTLRSEESKETMAVGQLLFIEGDMAVMPHHFVRFIEDWHVSRPDAQIIFSSCQSARFNITLDPAVFLTLKRAVVPQTDLCFVRFGRSLLKAHRHIGHFFLREDQLKTLFRDSAHHVRLDVARLRMDASHVNLDRIPMVSNVCEWVEEGEIVAGIGRILGLCKYDMPTARGDCGAPLSICEPRFYGGRSLLGIHVAGKAGWSTRIGFSQVISAEMISQARSLLDTYTDPFSVGVASDLKVDMRDPTDSEVSAAADAGVVDGSMLLLGVITNSAHVLHTANETKLFKSPMGLDEVYGPLPTAPAPLGPVTRDGERVFPMMRAMEAYRSPLEFREIAGMDAIVDMAMSRHQEATLNYGRHIYSFEEAVVPPEHVKMKPIPRSTSAGYPARLWGTTGKYDFFGKEDTYDFSSEQCAKLKESVELMVRKAARKERSAVVFTDFLKDELRSLEKVERVASRAISGAPLDYVVAVRMYFGAFIAAMFATCVRNGMSPGINPYTDWHTLVEGLQSKGSNHFGGDFKRFDASQQPYVFEYILGYINRWYKYNNVDWSQEDENVREVLWLDLVHSRHLYGVNRTADLVVQWNKSLPSGHPLTTVVNSMYSLITIVGCYAELTNDYTNFWSHCFTNTYGDDNINSVDDTMSELFNQVTVSQCMATKFGMDYTSDKKGAELVPFEPIEEVTFLKRSFKRHPRSDGGWVAPLALESFLYVPCWLRSNRDVKMTMLDNVKHMLGELSYHDAELWDLHYGQTSRWYQENRLALPFSSQDSAFQWMSTRNTVWF